MRSLGARTHDEVRSVELFRSEDPIHSDHGRSQSRRPFEVGLRLFAAILALGRTCPVGPSHQSKNGESVGEILELAPSCLLCGLLALSLLYMDKII